MTGSSQRTRSLRAAARSHPARLAWLPSLLLALCPSLVGDARAQPPQGDPADQVAFLTDQVAVQAQTLVRANDLDVDSMQKIAVVLDGAVSELVDASAPFPVLASLVPELQVREAALTHAALLGNASDVRSAAQNLLTQLRSFQAREASLVPLDVPVTVPVEPPPPFPPPDDAW